MSKNLATQTFTATASSGWTAPAGVTRVFLEGFGGGAGGGGGVAGQVSVNAQSPGGSGGGGSLKRGEWYTVVPNTAYDINIGAGGAGGAANTNGSDGGDTTFVTHGGSTVATFKGAGKGLAGLTAAVNTNYIYRPGGAATSPTLYVDPSTYTTPGMGGWTVAPSHGGIGGTYNNTTGGGGAVPTAGGSSPQGFAGGTFGAIGNTVGSNYGGTGGAGGGAGPGGVGGAGGAGGNGNNAGAGTAGSGGKTPSGAAQTAAITTNTGGGGGAGGGGGSDTSSTPAGGAGGGGDNGLLVLTWFE